MAMQEVDRETFGAWLREHSSAFTETVVETSSLVPSNLCAFQYTDEAGRLVAQSVAQAGTVRYHIAWGLAVPALEAAGGAS